MAAWCSGPGPFDAMEIKTVEEKGFIHLYVCSHESSGAAGCLYKCMTSIRKSHFSPSMKQKVEDEFPGVGWQDLGDSDCHGIPAVRGFFEHRGHGCQGSMHPMEKTKGQPWKWES